ncbi:MAG: mannose-1-phosphate guanylyltransferase [Bacteroidetes bacterium]|nr:mannose-1-phosphate guanylyltransferase [Bacteroidota bacterium]MCW5895287.1 mannose-1-phosphate guanylyltransferase [Bacteroidota bacterium]
MSNIYPVIMAGGIGTRFWPRSREKSPKQLLEIIGKGTLIQNTAKRFNNFVPKGNILVVTNRNQKTLAAKQLEEVLIKEDQIIAEPVGRNTAVCIGLAALHIRRRDPNGVMIVLPADHLIENTIEYERVIRLAVEIAQDSDNLITVGIKPQYPETGYGYIQMFNEEGEHNPFFSRGVFKVKTFAEKPTLHVAEKFLASGDFLWNSGQFVWRADLILKKLEEFLPDLYAELMKVDETIGTTQYNATLEKVYGIIRGISIDYGVMEKAKDVYVIPGNFGWSDIGSWDEVFKMSGKDEQGNSITGSVIQKDTQNCYIYSQNKVIATVGVEDLIVVDTGDALLICKRGMSQEVKDIADYLKRKQMNEYL